MEKTVEIKAYLSHQKKILVLQYVKDFKSVNKVLKDFNIPKSTYYKWKKAFDKDGAGGLLRQHPVAYNHPNKIKEDVIDKVLILRKEYQLGYWRTKWYLERYHDINVSESSVPRIFKRYDVEKLHKKAAKRALHSKRYNKSTPGHDVQIDVKVLMLKDSKGTAIKRFQYTAVDDATRFSNLTN